MGGLNKCIFDASAGVGRFTRLIQALASDLKYPSGRVISQLSRGIERPQDKHVWGVRNSILQMEVLHEGIGLHDESGEI